MLRVMLLLMLFVITFFVVVLCCRTVIFVFKILVCLMAAQVVVSNLSPQLNEEHLQELFSCCGTITDLILDIAAGTCTVMSLTLC